MRASAGRVMLAAAAAATLASLLLVAAFAGAAGTRPRLLLPPLAAWDRADALLDRHRASPGGPTSRRDLRPLRVQAAEMEADLRRRFLTADGRFFLSSTP